jgi:type IV pilus assembly protein PilB
MAKKRLGELLVEAGLISREKLNYALIVHKNSSEKLGQTVMRLGYITEDILLEFLGKQHGTSSINLYKEVFDERVVNVIPRSVAEKYKALAVGFKLDGRIEKLIVAMANPSDLEVVDILAFTTGYIIKPIFAREEDLEKVIYYHYQKKIELK